MKLFSYSCVAVGLSVSCLNVAVAEGDEPISAPGAFVGAKALYLTPYFESDILGADRESGANGSLEILSFDWDGDGAYRIWGGYETATGFGISIAHMGLNQATDFSQAEGSGELEVQFNPNSDTANFGADINDVDGTLNASNELSLNVTDLEAWQKVKFPSMMLRYGAGLRYASLDRSYRATETGGDEFVNFNHSFQGFGPSLSYEVEIPVANGFSLYNSGRGALLFGTHEASYQGEEISEDSGSSETYAMLPTLDVELGLQWRGRLGAMPGELTVRAGFEAQAYINGGGWDMYDPESGATFPQQAGSFGLQGFSISAQYKFSADDADHTIEAGTDAPAIVMPGVFVGAKALYLTPYFESDILGADEQSGADNSLEILSFDWDGDGAYRIWGGYETATGFGVSIAHMGLNHGTDFSQAEGSGRLGVQFDPGNGGGSGSDDASLTVNDGETLNVENTLSLNVTDLEAWQKVKFPSMMLRYGAGLRFASLDRSYRATETGGDEFVNFDHSFNGFGPSLSYEVEIPVAKGFSLYNSGRGALLFGTHKSSYLGEEIGRDAGSSENHAMLPTLDAELGLQWRGRLGAMPGELTVRAGFEAQAYINGGGWDMYKDDMGAIFPQQAGSFGLQGFSISAQYKFSAEDADYLVEADTEAPKIVMPGVFVGAKALYLTPYFESDILGADQASGADNSPEILSFDWDGGGAYRVWGGYETASGFGISIAHMGLNHDTDFSQAEDIGGDLQVQFDTDAAAADISNVDGTLNVRNELSLNVTDLEAWQKVKLSKMMMRYGAGLRFASLDRSYRATETGGDEFVNFDHSFEGFGPSLSYEVEIPVAKGFSLYNSGRGALLFGKHESGFRDEKISNNAGSNENYAMLPTLDAELGLQWRGMLGALPGELTVRAGFEAQAYINGGGWDLYDNGGGTTFPQQAGSFGLHGFNVSAQYKFDLPN